MLKKGDKLQKLIILLGVWGLLLATMIVYERYFVSTQQAFLKDKEFHTLERLAEELSVQVQRAQLSTQSFVRLAAGNPKQDDAVLGEFLKLYLPGVWNGTEYISVRTNAISD